MTSNVSVLIVEPEALVRSGFQSLLEGFRDVGVVGEAEDGRAAVDLAAELEPDLVLTEIVLPELSGMETIRRITSAGSGTRVLVCSSYRDEAFVQRALKAGASGYLIKRAEAGEMREAIRAVVQGEIYLCADISDAVTDSSLEEVECQPCVSPLDQLTPRQREVLQLVAEGHTTSEIAEKLELSPRTIESHRRDLKSRLGIQTIAGLVRFAVGSGLVPPLRRAP